MLCVSKKSELIPRSAIRKMAGAAAGMENVISFALGEPDFTTDETIIKAGIETLKAGETHYTPNAGLLSLREAVSENYKARGFNYEPTEVIITVGGMEALFLALQAILDPDDEVIISNPYWTNYNAMVIQVGAKPVLVDVYEKNDFMFNIQDVRNAITDKTKAILINSPSNPTGGVASKETLADIANLANEKNIYIISDEIYKHILYTEEEYVSIASFAGMKERTIIVDGFSKAYAMTGWRVGYSAGPEEVITTMIKLQENIVSCVSAVSQNAAIAALKGSQKPVSDMLEQYANRRRILVDGLNDIDNICCIEPKGAFYAFPNISKTGLTSEEFAMKLLKEKQVIVVPGSGFGSGGEGFIRISYATSEENIRTGLKRIKEFVEAL